LEKTQFAEIPLRLDEVIANGVKQHCERSKVGRWMLESSNLFGSWKFVIAIRLWGETIASWSCSCALYLVPYLVLGSWPSWFLFLKFRAMIKIILRQHFEISSGTRDLLLSIFSVYQLQ
jgi:hypothetical protein